MSENISKEVYLKAKQDSTKFNSTNEVAVILAAGHGKRIKSQTSKMLHKIWEITTVERVIMPASLELKTLTQLL